MTAPEPGPAEAGDWVARIERELEPLQRAAQRFARGLEQISKASAAARAAWHPLFEAWRAFVAVRDRGDFRNLWLRLRLTGWIVQRFNDAKGNPSHRAARVWLRMGQHLTPKQVAELLPYMMMDTPDLLRIPKRRGRPRRPAASRLEMAEQLDKRIKRTGELPTTAAKRLLRDYGFRGDLKGPADHLVRLWKNRAFKSR